MEMNYIQVRVETIGAIRLSSDDPGLYVSLFNAGAPMEAVVMVDCDKEILGVSDDLQLGRQQEIKIGLRLDSPEGWEPGARTIHIKVVDADNTIIAQKDITAMVLPSRNIDRYEKGWMGKIRKTIEHWMAGQSSTPGKIDDVTDLYEDIGNLQLDENSNGRYMQIRDPEELESCGIGNRLDIACYSIYWLCLRKHSCILIHLDNEYLVGIYDSSERPDPESCNMIFNPSDSVRGLSLAHSHDRYRMRIRNSANLLKKGTDWESIKAL